jgi:hypothetical protein
MSLPIEQQFDSATNVNSAKTGTLNYEQQLASNERWALSEGSRHFDEKSAVFAALNKIARRLDELQIQYVIVGGMALFKYGFRRFTEDVDILVKKSDLKRIHDSLEGLGYIAVHKHSKHLRDAENAVRIEFLTAGDFPGDGKPKAFAFPDPESVTGQSGAIKYISLPALIDMKLASGMTGADRLKDLSDVLELIKILQLKADFAEQLDPYVREKFRELCKQATRRYVTIWRNKWLTAHAKSIDDMIAALGEGARTLEAMRNDGVMLDYDESVSDDYARLVTTDPEIAKKYDMVEESEFWGDEGDDEQGPQSPG